MYYFSTQQNLVRVGRLIQLWHGFNSPHLSGENMLQGLQRKPETTVCNPMCTMFS